MWMRGEEVHWLSAHDVRTMYHFVFRQWEKDFDLCMVNSLLYKL
jgi:hypothetical protein